MKNPFSRGSKFGLYLLVALIGIFLACLVGQIGILKPAGVEAKMTKEPIGPEQETIRLDKDHPVIQAAISVQERHHDRLMGIPEAFGTAIGFNEAGRLAILVFTKDIVGPGVVPEILEGLPVHVKVTGEIFAMKDHSPDKGGQISPAAAIGPYTQPVPIGVSTGVYNHGKNDCLAGTIACRVRDSSGHVYALSNNHVYALENTAPIGSPVVQPGLYDATPQCAFNQNNVIGTLSNFARIVFSTRASNTIDAAIAKIIYDSSTGWLLAKATPADGYGTPSSTPKSASINQSVQKYGRTTSLTKGTVTAINVTVNVGYGYPFGTARFVKQIAISSSTAFIQPGDSGSLLVTDDLSPNPNPVGLLFAGNSSGTYAIANPIGNVLNYFGVAIDGE